MIQKFYCQLDINYPLHSSRIRQSKVCALEDKLAAKTHATQIDSIILLDNGDVAVSGGPKGFEIIIYRNLVEGNSRVKATKKYEIVDSISTGGYPVR